MIRFAAKAAAAATLLSSLGGCYIPVPETVYSPCRATDTSDWAASLEGRTLMVSGKATVPTGGYAVALELGPIEEIQPRTQQILLRTTPPAEGATQALVTHDVSGTFRVPRDIGQVSIRCGDGIVGRVPVAQEASGG